MAEQKTDETKPAVPRRGARPFIGPAGAGAGARPLLRPSAAPDRSRPAAFAPPVALPEQPSLGAAPPASVAVEPVTAVDTSPAFDVPASEPSTVHETVASAQVVFVSEALPDIAPGIPSSATDEPELYAGHDDFVPPPVMAGRPVTSEMVAIDAVDAFDAVWSAAATGAVGAPPTAQDVSSPLDELSLGGGLDGPHVWTDEIMVPSDHLAAVSGSGVAPAEDVVTSEAESPDVIADLSMPAWLSDEPQIGVGDAEPTVAVADDTVTPAEGLEDTSWPDPLLAEYAPYIPTPSSLSAIIPAAEQLAASMPAAIESAVVDTSIHDEPPTGEPSIHSPSAEATDALYSPSAEATDAPGDAIVAGLAGGSVPVPVASDDAMPAWMHDATAVQPDAVLEPTAHVTAALSRLAERVRSGEIDVSSVAVEATDAAVLASVLAALLGGSSSR